MLERKLMTGIHGVGDDPSPDGVALVRAAVDWARCGRTDPIGRSELRNLWACYLGPGAVLNDSAFDRALEWALRPVAGTIALLHRAGGFQAFDYVVRLLRDDPRAESPLEEAWTTAIQSASDAQALAVGTAAYQHERRTDALRVLSVARHSEVHAVAAIAGFNTGVVLSELGRSAEEIEVYDEVVARFGDAPEAALREQVGRALVNKGVRLGQL
ncbi:MAG TPA: hypothetical protein VGR26_18550, partial [Acidimicrobiales bacterium]|nr:hypothetical protein [Acidimicrobiales bacterium]